jgi:hypothetical protein
MRAIAAISRIPPTRLKIFLTIFVFAFLLALIMEVRVTHEPWWTRAKDLLLLSIAIFTVYRQLVSDPPITFFDSSDQKDEDEDLANVYVFKIHIERPSATSLELVAYDASKCTATLISEDKASAIPVDVSTSTEEADKVYLKVRLPSAPVGEYQLSGSIILRFDVSFEPRGLVRPFTIRFPVDCVVSRSEEEGWDND